MWAVITQYNSTFQHLLPRAKHENKNGWGIYTMLRASNTTLGDGHFSQVLPVPTFSGKPQVLCQTFKTRQPYLRTSGIPDGKRQRRLIKRPQGSQCIHSPLVMSSSVVHDWDNICLPEETFLTGQS